MRRHLRIANGRVQVAQSSLFPGWVPLCCSADIVVVTVITANMLGLTGCSRRRQDPQGAEDPVDEEDAVEGLAQGLDLGHGGLVEVRICALRWEDGVEVGVVEHCEARYRRSDGCSEEGGYFALAELPVGLLELESFVDGHFLGVCK